MLTETLLRAQERQAGSDQPDLPQEVPADSSEQPHQRGDEGGNQRARVSSASSDFEPFEVIDEEVEGKVSHHEIAECRAHAPQYSEILIWSLLLKQQSA